MGSKDILLMGVSTFTRLDLFKKAAEYKGLKLNEGCSRALSRTIKEYTLDEKLLAALAERGIKRQARPDCRDEIFTLVDENPQEETPGWKPSNGWNFRLLEGEENKFDLRISVKCGFRIDEKAGMVFIPLAHGSFISAADALPNFRMFKTLVDNDKDASVIAKELAESDGSFTVTWESLGLKGICSLIDLFDTFAGNKEAIKRLGKSAEVFNPLPNPQYKHPGDELFVTESVQNFIVYLWRQQLRKYCIDLTPSLF